MTTHTPGPWKWRNEYPALMADMLFDLKQSNALLKSFSEDLTGHDLICAKNRIEGNEATIAKAEGRK